MAERSVEHEYPCDEETFWNELFLNEEHGQACYQALGFGRYEVIRSEQREGRVHRVVEAVPPEVQLPGPLKKLLANGSGYRETGVYDPSTRQYEVNVTPFSLADRLEIRGKLYTRPTPSGCQRVYVAQVKAKVFGIGALVERTILDNTEKAYAHSARFSREWLHGKRPA